MTTSVIVKDHTAWRAACEERGGECPDGEGGGQVITTAEPTTLRECGSITVAVQTSPSTVRT